MHADLLKEVWKIRFEKMLKVEKESAEIYEKILREYRDILTKTGADKILEEVIADEKKHVKLTENLCRMAREIYIPEYETEEAD